MLSYFGLDDENNMDLIFSLMFFLLGYSYFLSIGGDMCYSIRWRVRVSFVGWRRVLCFVLEGKEVDCCRSLLSVSDIFSESFTLFLRFGLKSMTFS